MRWWRRPSPVDILVNNAGITRDMLALRLKDADWQAVLDTNLTAAFRLARAALRGMIKRRFGRIVNITSIVGVTGNPGPGQLRRGQGRADRHVQGAGAGGGGARRHRELRGAGLHRHGDDPGARRAAARGAARPDPRRPARRRAPTSPPRVVYLASDEAGYVTGQTLHVNGGMAMI